MKKIHINPQSKGSLGKSFETETRVAFLDACQIPWYGYDLDDRHHTFADRHPDKVELVSLEDGPKDAILSLVKSALGRPESVILIDSRAQADALIMEAFESLSVFERAAQDQTEFLISLFPSDDNESLQNLAQIAKWGAGQAGFLIVRNPAKSKARMFDQSPLKSTLVDKLDAKEITIPSVTATTLEVLEKLERSERRSISFSEFAEGVSSIDPLCTGEVAYLLSQMARQYALVAELLLPTDQLDKVPVLDAPKAKKSSNFNFDL